MGLAGKYAFINKTKLHYKGLLAIRLCIHLTYHQQNSDRMNVY